MTSSFLAKYQVISFGGAGKEIKYGMIKSYDTYKTVPMQNDEKLPACVPALRTLSTTGD